uniref:Uncharacterized protein n=1 Tax=Caenorhabditis japonica TaxID=281687 RepID=A0A8R1DWK9_CAEJA
MTAAKCEAINFEAVESNLTSSHLALKGYQAMNALCFEMDDSIGEEFFGSVLEVSRAKKFIFHACDQVPQGFVRNLFKKWVSGSRELHAVRITSNQNFSFEEIIQDIEMSKLDNSTWKMKNTVGDEALITMRRNAFHFFVAFEVNEHRVEDILYKIPFIE